QRLSRRHTTSTSSMTSAIRMMLIWPRKTVRHTGSNPKDTIVKISVARAGEAHRGNSPTRWGNEAIVTRTNRAKARKDTAETTPHATCTGKNASGVNNSAAAGG